MNRCRACKGRGAPFEVSVQMFRGFGTESGFDKPLDLIGRIIQFALARAFARDRVGGRWKLMVYVIRDP
jgi:hypothetical protein